MRYRRFFNKDTILIVFFCVFIGVFCGLYFMLPDKTFSENEKRVLQGNPEFSGERLFNGKFGKEFENYLSDQFAGRDFFVGLNAYYDLAIGRNGVNGVYAGKDGYLIEKPVVPEGSAFADNIRAVNTFAQRTGITPDVIIVPTAGYICADKLPDVHEEYRDEELLNKAADGLTSARDIDLVAPFMALRDGEQLYYRTDHHWTSQGAYAAYRAYCEAKGIKPVPADRFSVEQVDGFYGTTYSRSALWLKKPDTIDLFIDKSKPEIKVEIPEADIVSDSLYFEDHLNREDKYPVFLDGNHGYVKITNADAKGGKLLLIKDSYAHAMAPFLIENYSEVYMVDLRYYRQSVATLIRDEGIDNVLILYGLGNFVNDTNLRMLNAGV